ncbi:hypothetical protein BGX31_006397 [Mortierella sp. GBA43]|nr:hypothetical protein BGX31_006397 [Mortierella sp. GBA43]
MTTQFKITHQEDGRKQENTFEFSPSMSCRMAVEQVCSTLGIAEDWAFAMYSKKHGGWIHDGTRIGDIGFKGSKSMELRLKSSSYFETQPATSTLEPVKSSSRDTTLLRGASSPIDHHRIFGFFRSADDSFVSKLENGSIYLTLIILNSDNKILLSPTGMPPMVLLSTVAGLANYYNFDSDSSDFAWMLKTTMDWASDPPPNRFRDPRSNTASPEPRFPFPSPGADSPGGSATISPPNSRGSFPRSKRGSISSTAGLASSSNGSGGIGDISIFGLKLATSTISLDRSSIASDSTRRQSIYEYLDRKRDYRGEKSLRQEYVAAVEEMQRKLGCPPIDLLYDKVVDLPLVGAKSVIAIQYARDDSRDAIAPELLQMGSFRWRHMESVSSSIYTKKEDIWPNLTNFYDNVRGLYVGLYYTESTMSGLQILVPKKRRTYIPVVKLREDANLSPEEWEWIQSTASMDPEELARECAVSKDDPMHRLKIGFSQSTAKLSRQTQLKWSPSDLYVLDTLQVSIQATTMSQTRVPQEVHPFALPPEPPKQGSMATVQQSTAAMDQDSIWKTRVIDAATSKTFRVILFVKPTRHATQPPELFNRRLYELCPFPIFDALHHSVFNGTTYHQLRKSMRQVTNEIVDLEIGMEQELEQGIKLLKEREGIDMNQHCESKGNGGDEVDSALIDELGIKRECSPPRMQHRPQRHRSSSAGDDAIRKARFGKRSSANSLGEAFERSAPLVTSIMSLSSLLSPNGRENSAIGFGPQPSSVGMERVRSRTSTIEFELDRATSSASRRRGSKASQPDISRIVEKAGDEENEALVDFKEMLQDLEPTTSDSILRSARKNISSLSVQSTDSSASTSSDEGNIHGVCCGHGQIRRPLSACSGTSTSINRPLPLFWPTPRHRRSYSLVQSNDEPLSPGSSSAFSAVGLVRDGNSTRFRTNSHSSFTYAHHHHHHPYHHHYQQPVYKNRFLTGKNYPHYLAHIQQHENHLPQHHNQSDHHQQQPEEQQQQQQQQQYYDLHEHQPDQQQDDDDYPCFEGCDMISQTSSELMRLERQRQDLQERWRLVSWTRQLNEWDHARTLKSQGDILGFGLDLGLTMAMNMNLGGDESDPKVGPVSEPQRSGLLSPPQSNSQSSLQSEKQ